jgi:sigma-E factor negative regulatory protein RseC
MIDCEAIVTRVDGDYVWLDVESGCSNCDKTGSCGLGDGRGQGLQRMRNTVAAKMGDHVILTVPAGAVLRAVFHSYVLPLTLAVAGAVMGTALQGETTAVTGTLLGLVAGWSLLRRQNRSEPTLRMRLKGRVITLHGNAHS